MAKYKSKYKELTFFINGVAHRFMNGEFSTDDEKVIEGLKNVRDVVLIEEKSDEKKKVTPEAKPKTARKKTAPKTSEK